MDDRRRMFLAISLLLLVAVLPSLFGPDRPPAATSAPPPGAAVDPPDNTAVTPEPSLPTPPPPTASIGAEPGPVEDPDEGVVYARSPLYQFGFSTLGGRLVEASLYDYRSLREGEPGVAQIVPDDSEFLDYYLVFQNDTVPLGDWHFEPSSDLVEVGTSGAEISWVAQRGPATVQLIYSFRPDDYRFDVRGEVSGIEAGAGLLLIGMGPHLRSVEVDTVEDQRAYGIVTKARKTVNHKYSSLDPGERLDLEGPFEWMAIKSKYFLSVILAIDEAQPPFGGGLAIGGASTGRQESRATAIATLPMPANRFSFSMYIGPQEYDRLAAIGHDLQDVNPYGWIFRPIIGPVSIVIVKALLWLHENLGWGYGWLLILFGVAIRVLLWPLNQKAMRSQMAMQALQPEIEALKKKHEGDQQRVGQETMKLYKERGVNPVGGCLPMLLPMPILFAFFFVFLNTIELRGVPWLWLPDLSRPDPLYIIPVLMGLSMFAVSKLGQKGIPPNPQSKMMLYIMPAFMTFLFLRFASGLNLYYASQNIASLPQQWLIAKERLKRLKV